MLRERNFGELVCHGLSPLNAPGSGEVPGAGCMFAFHRSPWRAGKSANQVSDFVAVRLEREVSRVEEVESPPSAGHGGTAWPLPQEDGVILAPDDQGGRLIVAEILLEARIQRHVGAVIVEQVELDLVVARAVEPGLVESPSVRTQQRRIGDPIRVLPVGRLRFEQRAQRVAVLPVSDPASTS